jgi:hypothetical protein
MYRIFSAIRDMARVRTEQYFEVKVRISSSVSHWIAASLEEPIHG